MKRLLILVGMAFLMSGQLLSFTARDVYAAWDKKDIAKLVRIHNENSSLRPLCEEALIGLDFDYSTLNYEEVLYMYLNFKDDPVLGAIFKEQLDVCRGNVMSEVMQSGSVDDLNDYIYSHPQQKDFVEEQIRRCVMSHLSELSIGELYYVSNELTSLDTRAIEREMSGRGDERRRIMADRVSDYVREEMSESEYVVFYLKMRIYQYLSSVYRGVCYDYAANGQVSENVSFMYSQFYQIMGRHFSTSDLQEFMQNEVNTICRTINDGRSEYCRIAGYQNTKQLSVTVPRISFNANIPSGGLYDIQKAYQDYRSSRETISTVGSIASWFFGSLVTTIGEGVADMVAGSSLTDDVIAGRMKFVEEAYSTLSDDIIRQLEPVERQVRSQVRANEAEFVTFVKSHQ